jgi:hypothetical protein
VLHPPVESGEYSAEQYATACRKLGVTQSVVDPVDPGVPLTFAVISLRRSEVM